MPYRTFIDEGLQNTIDSEFDENNVAEWSMFNESRVEDYIDYWNNISGNTAFQRNDKDFYKINIDQATVTQNTLNTQAIRDQLSADYRNGKVPVFDPHNRAKAQAYAAYFNNLMGATIMQCQESPIFGVKIVPPEAST